MQQKEKRFVCQCLFAFHREKRPVGGLNSTICFTSSQKLLIPRRGRTFLFLLFDHPCINPICRVFHLNYNTRKKYKFTDLKIDIYTHIDAKISRYSRDTSQCSFFFMSVPVSLAGICRPRRTPRKLYVYVDNILWE